MHSDKPTLPDDAHLSLDDDLVVAAFADDDESLVLLSHALGAPDPRRRVLAVRALARRERLSETQWLAALGDDSPEVRRETLAALARRAPERVLDERATELLEDPHPLVVDAAAFVAGEHETHEALDALVRVVTHHEDARCREAAVAALGALGDDDGLAAVMAALEDKPSVRRRAVVALANFEGPEVEAALARAGEDRDWQVRAAVDQLQRDDETE